MRNQNDEMQQEPMGQEAKEAAASSANAARLPTPPHKEALYIIRHRRWLIFIVALLVVTALALALMFSRSPSSLAGRPVPAPSGTGVSSPASETLSSVE